MRLGLDNNKQKCGEALPTESSNRTIDTAPVDDLLRGLLKKGRMSAPDVQEASQQIVSILPGASSTSSASSTSILDWAGAGAGGTRPGNTSRDITTQMSKTSTMAPIYASPVTFWDPLKCESYKDDVYFLLPHETLKAEVTGATSEWTDLAPDSSHKRVLDELKESQSIDKGCGFAAAGLWADSATYHTRDSLFLVLFNILSGVFHHRLWISAYSKRMACSCGCKGRCTFTDIWRVTVWSFDAARLVVILNLGMMV